MHKELARHSLRIKMTQQLLIAHARFDDCLVLMQSINGQEESH